jgi:CMP-N,N'-diacetyllegionaminic acid synthase
MLAIITARGGSKGLPKKNLFPLKGVPLIQYTIDAAQKCSFISKVLVSSDNEEILEYCNKFNVITQKRPSELSTDTASSLDVIEYCLNNFNEPSNDFILLQPTSPLRNQSHISEAVKLYLDKKPLSLISVSSLGSKPFKSYKLDNSGSLVPLFDEKTAFLPRQSLPESFLPNGAIYIMNKINFLKHKTLFLKPCLPFVMDEVSSYDVDNLDDIKKIELHLKES